MYLLVVGITNATENDSVISPLCFVVNELFVEWVERVCVPCCFHCVLYFWNYTYARNSPTCLRLLVKVVPERRRVVSRVWVLGLFAELSYTLTMSPLLLNLRTFS